MNIFMRKLNLYVVEAFPRACAVRLYIRTAPAASGIGPPVAVALRRRRPSPPSPFATVAVVHVLDMSVPSVQPEKAHVLDLMSVLSVQPEKEKATNPGLIIIYDMEAVHVALGQPDSPVIQGATQAESVEAFKKYVIDVLMLTPCSDEEHGVQKRSTPGTIDYYPELLQRLPADTYRKVILRLGHVFAHGNTTTSRWAVRVSLGVGLPNTLPPHRPLGSLVKVQGGVGQGQLLMERVAESDGIFHN